MKGTEAPSCDVGFEPVLPATKYPFHYVTHLFIYDLIFKICDLQQIQILNHNSQIINVTTRKKTHSVFV